jgi:hypothetical protein
MVISVHTWQLHTHAKREQKENKIKILKGNMIKFVFTQAFIGLVSI